MDPKELKGKIVHKGGRSFLTIEGIDDKFEVEKIRDGVYELIEDEAALIIAGVSVDIVIVVEGEVAYYCETVEPAEVTLEDVEIE